MNDFGLDRADIERIQKIFSFYPEVEKAILYGSRAIGTYRPASDIDISLIGKKLNLSILQNIETELDDLLLPYKIDLCIFHQIQNNDLIDHIERVGKPLYNRH